MSNKVYALRFTPKASEDLEDIYMYIAGKLFAENVAQNLLDKIESSIIRLKSFPYSSSYVSDDMLKNKGYRKLVVDNYIVFYIVNEEDNRL